MQRAPNLEPNANLGDYQRRRRLLLAIGIAIGCAFLIFTNSTQTELMHERIEGGGLALILLGIGGRLWATLYIGGHKSSDIIQIGPYSIMRNPLYFFSAVAAAGLGAQLGSYWMALAFAIACWAAFMIVIRREEAFLAQKFGPPYLDYMARTPRFFPNPWLYRDNEQVQFTPRLLWKTLRDGSVFIAAMLAFELIEVLQEVGVLPVLFRLS